MLKLTEAGRRKAEPPSLDINLFKLLQNSDKIVIDISLMVSFQCFIAGIFSFLSFCVFILMSQLKKKFKEVFF